MPKTTAEMLGQYQKELVQAGVDGELVTELVRHAGFVLHQQNDGLRVSDEGQAAK